VKVGSRIALFQLAYIFQFPFGMYGETGYYYFLGPIDTIAVLMLVLGIFGLDYLLLPLRDTFPMRALRDTKRLLRRQKPLLRRSRPLQPRSKHWLRLSLPVAGLQL